MTTLLDQVPAAFERVRREIVLARFIGKLAVDQGVRELRSRMDELVGGAGVSPPDVDAPADAIVPAREPDDPGPQTHVDVASLALADYDHLPASDIVALLDDLDPSERTTIEAYERAGRHRRTILGKIDQLRGEVG